MDERLKNFTDDDLRNELKQRKAYRMSIPLEKRENYNFWEGEVYEVINPYAYNIYDIWFKVKNPSVKGDMDIETIKNSQFRLARGCRFRRRTIPKVGDIVRLRHLSTPSSLKGQLCNSKIVKILEK